MRQLGDEEKAALLLPAADDEDEELFRPSPSVRTDLFPVITKHPRTYPRPSSSNIHPVLCFGLVLGAFVLGCLSGVAIILYRMSQETEQSPPPISTKVDLTLRTKLGESITNTSFLTLNHSIESDEQIAAGKLFDKWQVYSPSLSNLKQFSYEIHLSQYPSSSDKRNGIDIMDNKDLEVLKLERLSNANLLSPSSLLQSTSITANSIYYVNYGREEDFAYLFDQRIDLNDQQQSIVVLRRSSTVLSQTEQIHQAIHYGFGGLIFFDDIDQQQTSTTNTRHSFYREWARYPSAADRSNYLQGISPDKDHSIAILVLSSDDVEKLFSSFSSDSSSWPAAPPQWSDNRPSPRRIGGALTNFKVRLVTNFEAKKVQLPVVMSSIRGEIDPERFVMVGARLGAQQQNEILTEIIRVYTDQMKKGWKPKRSVLFCAWSGFDYDQYTVRRWFSENSFLTDKNLLTYLDLGHGILSNSTLNLHGSPLLEQMAYNAAEFVRSPLKHNHTCHNRQPMSMNHEHGKRKRREGDHHMHSKEDNESPCTEHRLLDEWLRASRNQFGGDQPRNLIQTLDTDSTASLLQLQYGIPSLVIEMTNEKAVINETFYTQDYLSTSFAEEISPEVYVAYAQFLTEMLRQLLDQPLIAFNLTIYAEQIDRFVREYIQQFQSQYRYLAYHLGDQNDFVKLWKELTETIREIQLRIDRSPKNDLNQIQLFNQQLIDFERLFLMKDPLPGMNSPSKISKHILIGPAVGLTKSVVPFPFLSNILYGIPEDPPTELCDQSQVLTLKLKEQVHFINRTLHGLDGFFF